MIRCCWNMMLCRLVCSFRRLEGSSALIFRLGWFWRWSHYFHSKRRELHAQWQWVTSQQPCVCKWPTVVNTALNLLLLFFFVFFSSSSFFSSFFFFFFIFWRYSPWWTLSSTTIARHCSRFCYSCLQFLTLFFFRSSSTDSNHLSLGFPTRREPSGLRTVSFQQASTSCILQRCPSYLSHSIFTSAFKIVNKILQPVKHSLNRFALGSSPYGPDAPRKHSLTRR